MTTLVSSINIALLLLGPRVSSFRKGPSVALSISNKPIGLINK
jgi:hypothetical protein